VIGTLLRSAHPAPTAVVTAVMTALTAAVGGSIGATVGVGAAVLAGQLSIGWNNDALDAHRDRLVGRADKPAANGLVPAVLLGRLAVAALAVALVLSLLVAPWPGALCHAVLLIAAWSYNLGLKRTAWSLLPYAVGFGALPGFATWAGAGAAPPWWLVVTSGLLGLAAGLSNAAADVDDDRRTDVRGAVLRIGPRRARAATIGTVVAATAVLVAGGSPGLVAAVAFVTVVAGVAAWGLRDAGGRRLFTAVLMIVVADVIVLLLIANDAVATGTTP
jgi:4-hydroxybenzoate polyprenyltransferase